MAVPIASDRHRIDGEDLIAGFHERADEQAPVCLDTDDHCGVILIGVLSHQGMELAYPHNRIWDSTSRIDQAFRAHHTDIVMILGPINSDKEHLTSSLDEPEEVSRRPNGSVLEARHPTSRLPPHRLAGHDLAIGLTARDRPVLSTRWLGDQLALASLVESH